MHGLYFAVFYRIFYIFNSRYTAVAAGYFRMCGCGVKAKRNCLAKVLPLQACVRLLLEAKASADSQDLRAALIGSNHTT